MLKGNLVGLRAIEKTDLTQLLQWRNNPEFRRFFREYRELNSENQLLWFEKYVINDPNTIMFAIVELATEKLIGACGLCYIDWVNRNADFSIYIGKNNLYIDASFAIEAAQLMEKYGFEELNLHRLWAEIYSIDEAKIKFFKELEFTQEGRFKDTHWTEGKWVDSVYYGKIGLN
ncbi:GNAT family N-acetyltransferase [Lysinibacillus sphaericus]|uniref:Acetyltransferase n=1 Tax=Lysinibacillus sphaericus TaxID=1421 RepID=A0A2S0K4Q6_LYSSH|nr:GNAT family protein [Lysinibacillus sphaericus]AVK98341.1 GNAT family N-acetyltransferase [Lysinibacillus sphaericus]MED4543858.1 GNAT family protein [Lysinibacillus sphaericus]TKI18466.1 GNAT family N-acetyltransferase [Lysinibacillus sphaericus]SUV15693.1 putative acetyltransferase [Lysinibacillus sphaericus]GEC80925.1 acetyltransferase [Lysinibacillus sphaericus]